MKWKQKKKKIKKQINRIKKSMKSITNFFRKFFSVSPEKQVKIETEECGCEVCQCGTPESNTESTELEAPPQEIVVNIEIPKEEPKVKKEKKSKGVPKNKQGKKEETSKKRSRKNKDA